VGGSGSAGDEEDGAREAADSEVFIVGAGVWWMDERWEAGDGVKRMRPCALFAWLISHQPAVLSLTTNQPPATSQQYSSLRTNQHQPSATSQPNRLMVGNTREMVCHVG
jgi:hypothetical protein